MPRKKKEKEERVEKEAKVKKPKKDEPVLQPVPDSPAAPVEEVVGGEEEIPDSGIIIETPAQRAFRMRMSVVYRGNIFTPDKEGSLPNESKEYLMNKNNLWIKNGE